MRKILLMLTLVLWVVAGAFAQALPKISVLDFKEEPFGIAATDARYKLLDGNGELFSIIKLSSTIADDDLRAYSFDFGYCESRVKEVNGEVWLYVQRNAMRVTITREGYKPLKYELNTTVQPGKDYVMRLSCEAQKVLKQMVHFNVTPKNSNAMVMYKSVGSSKETPLGIIDEYGELSINLPLGSYMYTIVSADYHASDGFLELTDPKKLHTEVVELKPNFSTITFKAERGVDIIVDGDTIGYGMCSLNLKKGAYNIEWHKECYKPGFDVINVTEGKNDTIYMKPLVPIVGSLSVITSPGGANITIDGENYGKTPANIDNLLIGKHRLVISKEGYESITETVDIIKDDLSEVKYRLTEVPVTGSIRVETSPKGAEIILNNKTGYSKVAPYVFDGLLPGMYDVTARKNGYGTVYKSVEVKAGKESALKMTLSKLPKLTIKSSVSGASVKVDGIYVGNTPLVMDNLSLGKHSVEVAKEGYTPQTFNVTLNDSDVQRDVQLQKVQQFVSLSVVSSPREASVRIDGEYVGTTPITVNNLKPGAYVVQVEKSGYNTATKNIVLNEGEARRLDMELTQSNTSSSYSSYNSNASSNSNTYSSSNSSSTSSNSSAKNSSKSSSYSLGYDDELDWMRWVNLGISASTGMYFNYDYEGMGFELGALARLGLLDFEESISLVPFTVGIKYQYAGMSSIKFPIGVDLTLSYLYLGLSYEPQLQIYYDEEFEKNALNFVHGVSLRAGIVSRHHDFNVFLHLNDFDEGEADGGGLGISYTYYF